MVFWVILVQKKEQGWFNRVRTENWNLFSRTFQGLFKDQIYFSRTLQGMMCYSFNKTNHSVPSKLTVFQCLKLLFQLVIQGLKFLCLFFGSSPEGIGLCQNNVSTLFQLHELIHNRWSIGSRLTFWLLLVFATFLPFYRILYSFYFVTLLHN